MLIFSAITRPRLVQRAFVAASFCAGLFGASACAQVTEAAAPDRDIVVTIDNFSFNPPELTISPGATVTWENRDDIPHTVVATGKAFRSKALDTGDRFSFTFATPGDFAFFCSLHPHMTGSVKVRSRAEGAAGPASPDALTLRSTSLQSITAGDRTH